VLRVVCALFLSSVIARILCRRHTATLTITEPFAALLAWAIALSARGWWRGTPTQDIYWLGDFELAVLFGLIVGWLVVMLVIHLGRGDETHRASRISEIR
jgi:hypothetical protein